MLWLLVIVLLLARVGCLYNTSLQESHRYCECVGGGGGGGVGGLSTEYSIDLITIKTPNPKNVGFS
jgi:hypothetical protein